MIVYTIQYTNNNKPKVYVYIAKFIRGHLLTDAYTTTEHKSLLVHTKIAPFHLHWQCFNILSLTMLPWYACQQRSQLMTHCTRTYDNIGLYALTAYVQTAICMGLLITENTHKELEVQLQKTLMFDYDTCK